MDNQPPTAAPLWKVGVPTQTTVADKQRGYVPAWEVPIILIDGSSFTVTIPASDFNPDNVQKLIEDHVGRLVAVRALEGPLT